MREDPQYPSFDHVMKEVHAQEEMESTLRVSYGSEFHLRYRANRVVPPPSSIDGSYTSTSESASVSSGMTTCFPLHTCCPCSVIRHTRASRQHPLHIAAAFKCTVDSVDTYPYSDASRELCELMALFHIYSRQNHGVRVRPFTNSQIRGASRRGAFFFDLKCTTSS